MTGRLKAGTGPKFFLGRSRTRRSPHLALQLVLIVSAHSCHDGTAPPRSDDWYQPAVNVTWIWVGAVTGHEAVVKARLADPAADPILRVSSDPQFAEFRSWSPHSQSRETGLVEFRLGGLEPDTRYGYAVDVNGAVDQVRAGSFRTFASGSWDFTLIFGSCAQTGSNSVVFDTIRDLQPDLFVHLGDFHYEDIAVDDPFVYRGVFDHVLASPSQSLLYRSTAVAYVWDDHDYGGDDSDSSHPGRTAARSVYRQMVPHYDLPARGAGAIFQSFWMGRVLFIITDNRSERLSPGGTEAATVLGKDQFEWFKRKLVEGRDAARLIIWLNSIPWLAPSDAAADDWGGFDGERRAIMDFIREQGIRNLAILGGDAHMTAIDEGRGSQLYGDPGGLIPVFQAGALDRPGQAKGGPYSLGEYPGRGQFGVMQVMEDRDTDTLRVKWSGRSWTNRAFVSYGFQVGPDRQIIKSQP